MIKLVLSGVITLCLLVGLSVAFNLHTIPTVDGNLPHSYAPKENMLAKVEWENTLKRVPAYYQPPKPQKKKPAKRRAAKVRKKSLKDAALIGVLASDTPQAILLLPGAKEVKYLNIGDSWLKPWVLEKVLSDYIVWSNSQTNEKQKQKLF